MSRASIHSSSLSCIDQKESKSQVTEEISRAQIEATLDAYLKEEKSIIQQKAIEQIQQSLSATQLSPAQIIYPKIRPLPSAVKISEGVPYKSPSDKPTICQQLLYIPGGNTQYSCNKDNNSFYINIMRSGRLGYGTSAIRKFAEWASKSGKELDLRLEAAWSSHIFYLKMGFIPIDYTRNYVSIMYGHMFDGKKMSDCLKDLSDEQIRAGEASVLISKLKCIINKELNIAKPTIDDVIQHRNFLLEILNAKCSSLQYDFIHRLLSVLKREGSKKHPNTKSLTSVNMIMSEAGKKRWAEAIATGQPFKPFGICELLESSMLPTDLQAYRALIERDAKNLHAAEASKAAAPAASVAASLVHSSPIYRIPSKAPSIPSVPAVASSVLPSLASPAPGD